MNFCPTATLTQNPPHALVGGHSVHPPRSETNFFVGTDGLYAAQDPSLRSRMTRGVTVRTNPSATLSQKRRATVSLPPYDVLTNINHKKAPRTGAFQIKIKSYKPYQRGVP